jgi:hypothetical protein
MGSPATAVVSARVRMAHTVLWVTWAAVAISRWERPRRAARSTAFW